jgi:hypothetical protein
MNKVFEQDAIWHQYGLGDKSDQHYETRNRFGHRGIVIEVANKSRAWVAVDKTLITYDCKSVAAGKQWVSDILDLTYLMEHLDYDQFNSKTLAKDPKSTLQWYAMSYAALTGKLVEMRLGECTFEVL